MLYIIVCLADPSLYGLYYLNVYGVAACVPLLCNLLALYILRLIIKYCAAFFELFLANYGVNYS